MNLPPDLREYNLTPKEEVDYCMRRAREAQHRIRNPGEGYTSAYWDCAHRTWITQAYDLRVEHGLTMTIELDDAIGDFVERLGGDEFKDTPEVREHIAKALNSAYEDVMRGKLYKEKKHASDT